MNVKKRITALFLAMMMALSIMAMPAAALEEEIQPRIQVPVCPYCEQFMTNTGVKNVAGTYYFLYVCYNNDCSHRGHEEYVLK